MRIDIYTGNPIIANQQDYYILEELLHEVEPDFQRVELRQEVVVIENLSRRTFKYPRYPSAEWVADGCAIWLKTGCKYALKAI